MDYVLRNYCGRRVVPVIQIQGYSFWLNFLPTRCRARLLAESVRLTYGGRYPWGGLGSDVLAEAQIQMPDGMCWNLRPVDGPEAPGRRDLQERLRSGTRGLRGAGILRACLLAAALALSIVPPLGRSAARLLDWLISWWATARVAMGWGRYARWEVRATSLPRLPAGPM